jgi:hypothetical protein
MYSRVTLLEIDTMRVDVEDAAQIFRAEVAPHLAEQEGFEGVVALVTPEGKGMIVSFWETEEEARDASGTASATLEQYVTLFRSPPGREYYEVAFADMAAVTV